MPPPVLIAGEVLAERFRIVRGLGQGGMGQVYEALDQELARSVALKVLRPELAVRPRVVERFKAEVRLAHRVTHPNVCRIFDLYQHRSPSSECPPLVFLTMEMLRGQTLDRRLLRAGPLDLDLAFNLLHQLADALAAAHEVGVVHGDLKPPNLVLTEERQKPRLVVIDFGLARALRGEGEPHHPPPGAAGAPAAGTPAAGTPAAGTPAAGAPAAGAPAAGTPAYMAPEQAATGRTTEASDLYSFGLVAYEMLTARRYSPAGGARPAPPAGATWPLGLAAMIRRCLRPSPEDRPSSARCLFDLGSPEAASAPRARLGPGAGS